MIHLALKYAKNVKNGSNLNANYSKTVVDMKNLVGFSERTFNFLILVCAHLYASEQVFIVKNGVKDESFFDQK